MTLKSIVLSSLLFTVATAVAQNSTPPTASPPASLPATPTTPPSAPKATPRPAPKPTLFPGDPAPALQIEDWLKGDKIAAFEPGKMYIITFWTTWSNASLSAFQTLNAVHRSYSSKGVTMIAVTSRDPRNPEDKIRAYVKQEGGPILGSIGLDTERKTWNAYLSALGNRYIPCSVIVNGEGKIAYFGRPIMLSAVLPKLMDGSWNVATDAKAALEAEKSFESLRTRIEADGDDVLTAIREFEDAHPFYGGIVAERKYIAQLKAGQQGALVTGAILFDRYQKENNADGLNELAWRMVDPAAKVKVLDLELALRAAVEASRITNRRNASMLDTEARCWFLKGDVAKAIQTQKEAIANAAANERPDMQKVLAQYEAAK
ncbi:MAG: redoxin domain-containing protein [Planctomycetes bacterium]|nr:redoxin domain-containing protein [Planctomycetota bacterium]